MSGRSEQALALPNADMVNAVQAVIGLSPDGVCRLSNAEIADRVGRSARTVGRALSELTSRGLIELTALRVTGPGQVGREIRLVANPSETVEEVSE